MTRKKSRNRLKKLLVNTRHKFGEDKRGKIHVYIDGVSMGDPYINMKAAQKEMKNIKNVIRQMGEENISKEEILGVINEINI